MAPRKRCRSVKVISKDYSKLTLNDVLCPICRNILFEPVSLPCNHGFCLPCFEGTVANSNLTCPLCRIRFASWHRVATKENKIVNECLWLAVKKLFPQLVQNRINGVDNNFEEENSIKLATPGDIRKEYEEERRKELLEIEKQRAVEARASEQLINQIRHQDDLEQTLKAVTLRKDEEIARKLSEHLNPKISQLQLDTTPKKVKPLDKYLVNMKKSEKKNSNTSINKKHITKILCQDKYPTYVITGKHNYEDKKHIKNGVVINAQKDIVLPSIYYFQPIEIIKTSSHISPIRIPVKQHRTNVIKIVAPKGTIAFIPNVISAFAKVCDSPPTIIECSPIRKPKEEQIKRTTAKKRKLFNEHSEESNLTIAKEDPQTSDSSPSKVTCQRKSTRLLGLQPELDSPPFRGFEPAVNNVSKTRSNCSVVVSNNNVVLAKGQTDKLEQEQKDLEFAKKLQEELNQTRWYSTRSSIPRNSNSCKKQRQIKLDEIIKCRSKVKAPNGIKSIIPNVISAFTKVGASSPTSIGCLSRLMAEEGQVKGSTTSKHTLLNKNPGRLTLTITKEDNEKTDSTSSKLSCQCDSIQSLGLQSELNSSIESIENNVSIRDSDRDVVNLNSVVLDKENIEKLEQEDRDLKYAKELQEKLNQMSWHNTRSSIRRNGNFSKKQRQVKLDEMIMFEREIK